MLWENKVKMFPPKTVLIVPNKTSPHRVSVVGVLFWVPCLWKSIPGTRVKWRVLKRGVKGLFVGTVISQTNERYGSWLGGLGVANVYS